MRMVFFVMLQAKTNACVYFLVQLSDVSSISVFWLGQRDLVIFIFFGCVSNIVASTTLAIAIYTNCNRDIHMQNNLAVIQRTPFIISIPTNENW